MKIENRIKKYLTEGTWSHPGTVKQAKKLENLFKKPIPAKNSEHILYDYLGDDTLFDELHNISRKDPYSDVRSFVASWVMNNWINDLNPKTGNTEDNSWSNAWEPEAIKILKKLFSKKYDIDRKNQESDSMGCLEHIIEVLKDDNLIDVYSSPKVGENGFPYAKVLIKDETTGRKLEFQIEYMKDK